MVVRQPVTIDILQPRSTSAGGYTYLSRSANAQPSAFGAWRRQTSMIAEDVRV